MRMERTLRAMGGVATIIVRTAAKVWEARDDSLVRLGAAT